jgi:hypothetical protein
MRKVPVMYQCLTLKLHPSTNWRQTLTSISSSFLPTRGRHNFLRYLLGHDCASRGNFRADTINSLRGLFSTSYGASQVVSEDGTPQIPGS